MKKMTVMWSVFAVLVFTCAGAFASEVYATKNGKKYHREVCRLIKNKNPQKVTMETALKKGLEPCQLCYKDAEDDTERKIENKSKQKTK